MPTRAILVLVASGVVLLLAGWSLIGLGLVAPELISSQIPAGVIDTPAVGGALVALGVGGNLLGLAHIGIGLAIRRQLPLALVGGGTLSATMAVISFLFGIAAVVSVSAASATPLIMVPAALILALATFAYAGVAWSLIGRVGRRPQH